MSDRRCDHNASSRDYATPQRGTLRIDRVCDACGNTLQTWHANAGEAA